MGRGRRSREAGGRMEEGAGSSELGGGSLCDTVQAHRSVGSGSPCRRPGCVFSIYFLTRSVLSLKFALARPCVNIKYSF